jgi:5-methylcytosine-specific restriction protein B
VIVYGPPGTGKSFLAKIAAELWIARNNFGKNYEELALSDISDISNFITFCCFHPSFSYEEFIIGYRPELIKDQMVFKPKDGIFKIICDTANKEENRKKSFILIIDEINRGDIPRIFGELMYALEKDKRNEKISIPLLKDQEKFVIPPNVYIIGTMNTADKSISQIDTALRRRFGFLELMPDYEIFKNSIIETGSLKIKLKVWLKNINKKIITSQLIKEGRNLQIGHSYFLNADSGSKKAKPINSAEDFSRILRDEIIPLLENYCYGDYESLSRILGEKIVDLQHQIINFDLFERNNTENLFKALIDNDPEIKEENVEPKQKSPDNMENEEGSDEEDESEENEIKK